MTYWNFKFKSVNDRKYYEYNIKEMI